MGHQVLFNPEFEDMVDADRVFFYPCDNVIGEASARKYPHKGPVFVNCIDIETWANQHNGVDWSWVDGGLLFISNHIQERVLKDIMPRISCKTAVISPGVSLDHFTLKQPSTVNTPLHRIAYVVGDHRIWDVKRFDVCLMLLRDLLNKTGKLWQLHVLGSYSSHAQYNDYCEHLIDNLNVNGFVIWHERQDDVNKWLEDKDYFILPSTKEAFSYATAEAMAKGIKPIIGNWRGASDVWKPFYCQTYTQMLEKFVEPYGDPLRYRQFIVDHYDEKKYFSNLDIFMQIGGETHG